MKKCGDSPTKGAKATMQLEADAAVAVHDSLKNYDAAALMEKIQNDVDGLVKDGL